jgi:hypothetical protein
MTLVFSCTVNSAKVLKWALSGRMVPCSLLMTVNHVLRRNFSFENIYLSKNERRVCVIYTGGTIGMVRSPCGGMIISYILPSALFDGLGLARWIRLAGMELGEEGKL